MSAKQYSVTFKNQSSNYGHVCIYQTEPDQSQDLVSLAWMAKATHPTTEVTFKWTTNYGFVWDETGELATGVIFKASQVWDADLEQKNKVSFSKINDAYTFSNQTNSNPPGSLIIEQDDTVPLKKASVGLSMAGSGIFVKQAQPNMTFMFSPHPEFWITFGNFETGEVLDINVITNKQKIQFTPGVFSITAVLNQDNKWTID